MAVRFLKWLGNLLLGAIVLWALTLGGGIVVSASVAGVSGLTQPWVSLLAAGVFLVSAAAIMGAIRVTLALLPPKARRVLQVSRPKPGFPLLPFTTPQQQLTNLLEEGRNWLRVIPEPARDAQGRLVQALTGADIDYPAKVYEWEMRAWRLLSKPGLAQWRGLFPRPERAQRLAELRQHLADRIGQLERVLGRL